MGPQVIELAITFLRAYWRYAAGALLLAGAWFWHHGKVADFRAEVERPAKEWKAAHLAEDAKREADIAALALTAKQRVDAAMAEAKRHNDEVLNALHDKTREAAGLRADRDLARRLLAIASQTAAGRCEVSEPGSAGGTAEAGEAGGDGSLTDAVAAAFNECRQNADQLDALVEVVKPQL